MKLSIIIPVYNEEQTVNEVIERVLAVDLQLALDQVEHRLVRELGRGVEIVVEAEGHPCIRGPRDRHAQLRAVAHVKRQLRAHDRALDRGA